MPESEAKKAWMKKNTTVITVKFTHNTERDFLDYLRAGKPATIIKAALREYMERHPIKREFCYGMRLRGYSPGCQPRGVKERRDDPSGKFYDILVYDRQLSADEIREYELEEI